MFCKSPTKVPADHTERLLDSDASSNLVLLPDLSTTAQRWNKNWLLMLSWLLTNILSVLHVVPLAASHQWSLVTDAAMISAAFGAAGIVQYLMRPRGQPEDVLDFTVQLGIVALCGYVAAALDTIIVGVCCAMLAGAGCVPLLLPATCSPAALHSFLAAAFFVCHGSLSYAAASQACALMPSMELVSASESDSLV